MNFRQIKIGSIVICLLLALVMVGGTIAHFSSLRKAEEGFRQKKAELEKLKSEIVEIQKMLDQFNKEKKEFSELLFTDRDIPAFLDQVSKFAKTADVDIVDMQTKQFYQVVIPAKNKPGYYTEEERVPSKEEQIQEVLTLAAMPIDVRLKGPFGSLIKFLDHLQDYKQLVSISDVEILLQNQTEYPLLDCKFTLRIYSLKTLEELKKK